jgi:hypothetical protein
MKKKIVLKKQKTSGIKIMAESQISNSQPAPLISIKC